MTENSRPRELRNLREAKVVERVLARSPEAQQAGVEFLLGLLKICEEDEEGDSEAREAMEALQTLLRYYIKRYPDFLEPQNLVDDALNRSSFTPSDNLIFVLKQISEKIYPPNIGTQFREFRGVERVLKGNPEVQQRGLKFLLSLYTLEIDRFKEGNHENKGTLRQVIRSYIDEFPECLEPQDKPDSDLAYNLFVPDPQVLDCLEEILNET